MPLTWGASVDALRPPINCLLAAEVRPSVPLSLTLTLHLHLGVSLTYSLLVGLCSSVSVSFTFYLSLSLYLSVLLPHLAPTKQIGVLSGVDRSYMKSPW